MSEVAACVRCTNEACSVLAKDAPDSWPPLDKSGGLNGSTQHSPEFLSADVSMAKFVASVDLRKTLPCLGLIEFSLKDQVLLKDTIGSTDKKGVESTG